MKQMFIKVMSGISADGFEIEIKEGLASLFAEQYRYGYNASFNRSWADEKKPFTTEIVAALMTEYGVARKDIIVSQGKNVFRGDLVDADRVTDFENNYLMHLK